MTLWYSYTLAEVTGTSPTLGVPAVELGVKNLLVRVPSASNKPDEERTAREALRDEYDELEGGM